MIIEISNLKVEAVIGILPFERVEPQLIVVDFKAEYKYKEGDFIDYSKIVTLISDLLIQERFGLLEDALLRIKDEIFNRFLPLESIELRLKKPNILPNCEVAISSKYKREELK